MGDKYPRFRIIIQIEDALNGQYDGPRYEIYKDDDENRATLVFEEILDNLEVKEEDTTYVPPN